MGIVISLDDYRRRKGLPRPAAVVRSSAVPERLRCSVDGCEKRRYGAGMCHGHYKASDVYRQRQEERARLPRCSEGGCGKHEHRDGRCRKHYEQEQRRVRAYWADMDRWQASLV